MSESPIAQPDEESRAFAWYLRGVRRCFSIPGLVLVSAFIGFSGLAREAGLTLAQTVFMTGVVWALPGQVVLIGAILAGNSLFAAAFAVALSSVRLAPMVVAITPEMQTPKTRGWVLYALSHFVAITSWVLAMGSFKTVPRPLRTAYYTGIGSTLVLVNMGVVATVFLVAETLPATVNAGLLFLTPIYFLTSLWGSARERAGHVAMILGLICGPVFHILMPGFDLLAAGVVAGVVSYAWHRMKAKNEEAG
ncbi:AzlC family ABC transporter permease [Nitratireductor kimnyeongensis]|uniref:AzlC family ABC transporter permease n=1 Tax=Nitratireductor kimnyeongensis TaxID=430679 RepID=A0ABW0T336_9HYPH|nr:AzlC family ABC transporter permease [Nitratireductor kimnyeongensis]QZZ35413.1 AzlC family ABC transporter permease [Nitratireductor kimnyeongensis]